MEISIPEMGTCPRRKYTCWAFSTSAGGGICGADPAMISATWGRAISRPRAGTSLTSGLAVRT